MSTANNENYDSKQLMTRGDFVASTLGMWEKLIADLKRKLITGVNSPYFAKTVMDMEIASKVLRNTFFAEEMMDFSAIKEQIDSIGSTDAII